VFVVRVGYVVHVSSSPLPVLLNVGIPPSLVVECHHPAPPCIVVSMSPHLCCQLSLACIVKCWCCVMWHWVWWLCCCQLLLLHYCYHLETGPISTLQAEACNSSVGCAVVA
jgi:hypothetical protein